MVMVCPPGSTRRSTPQVHLLLVLYATTGCFLLSMSRPYALVDAAAAPFSFSFDFSSASTYRSSDLRFEGDAALNGNLVDLTCETPAQVINNNCTGRMSYNHPVRLYDNTTGEVASFSTSFTFAIKPYYNVSGIEGGGMAFFLSGYPSRLPLGSGGGYLGLDDGKTTLGRDRYIAVEFDSYNNTWDPIGTKDRIDIVFSSVRSSSNTTSLPSSSLNGTMTASISFNCTTKMLIASLQFHDLPYLQPAHISMQLPDDMITSFLPPEVAVGFSAATGSSFKFHQIMSWSFSSTLARPELGSDINAALIITGVTLLVLVVWFTLSRFMWKRSGISFVKRAGLGEFLRFEYHHLAKATDNFSLKNKLGEGKFGVVYKGILKKHKGELDQVAVKRIKKSVIGEASDFLSELKASSRTSHKNLVRLKGWCCSRIKWKLFDFIFCRQRHNTDLFLVYELVPNGSLHDHLRLKKDMREQAVLSWEIRYKIVKGIASGLCYLHHCCKPYILHRDIKPQNILLEADFSPKLMDFGLSRIADDQSNTIASTIAIGTRGYMDPMCMKDGKVKYARTSDVYSFGIVLLEIACTGKNPGLVWKMYRQSGSEKFLEDAADAKLNGAFDRMQMKQVAVLGLWCCFADYAQRPSMEDAIKVLGNDAALLKRGMWILKHSTELPDEQMVLLNYIPRYAQRPPSMEDAIEVLRTLE